MKVINFFNIRSYVLTFGMLLALIPYDYIIKISGSMSLSPVIIAITLFLFFLFNRRIKFDKLNAYLLSIALLFNFSYLWSNGQPFNDCISFTMLIFLVIAMRSLHITDKEKNILEILAILGSTSLFFYLFYTGGGFSFFYNLTGRIAVGDFYSDPNGIAARQFLGMTIAIKRFYYSNSKIERIALAICFVTSSVIFIFAASRGAFLGFLVFYLLSAKLVFGASAKKIFNIILSFLGMAVLFSIMYKYLPLSIQYKLALFLNGEGIASVSNGRLYLWEIAFTDVLPNMFPWGHGISGAAYALEEFIGMHQTIHNTYLQSLIEFGYIGFILFMTIVFKASAISKNSRDKFYFPILMGVFTIVFFLSAFEVKYLWITIAICTLNYSNSCSNIIQIRQKG